MTRTTPPRRAGVVKTALAAAALATLALGSHAATQPDATAALTTRWAADLDPAAPLPEYPRPGLVREEWLNLNGLWDYAVTSLDAPAPREYDGQILVPFPVESTLSGVGRLVDGRRLWYRRTFEPPPDWRAQRLLLHFGAVDWDTVVWLNGVEIGRHRGGYDPFTFDVTDALVAGVQELVVAVFDPTDAGSQPRGKQVREPGGIWYTPTTGIWQTVWLEPVPTLAIAGLTLRSDLAASAVLVEVQTRGSAGADALVTAELIEEGRPVAAGSGAPGDTLVLEVASPRLWSPDTPFLYDLTVRLERGGETLDEVRSYHGMREIALGRTADGHTRLFLNGEPLFQYGLLDQGYWPDGLYTAPSDEALRHDLEVTKRLGFNLVRKHVKVEPARWYTWADRLGLLVWQDMPSGDAYAANGGGEIVRSEASARQFEHELRRMVDTLHNHPSVVMWVLFNEGWGQADTDRLSAWLEAYDPSRLVDAASGWNDLGVGDVVDVHRYPGPGAPDPDPARASVLGEFGGLGLALPGRIWREDATWSYDTLADARELEGRYRDLVTQLRGLIVREGLAAAVYTQTTDVESEVNGLMSYDREVVKLEPVALAFLNRVVYRPLPTVEALVPGAEPKAHRWRYTVDAPPPEWAQPGFDDVGWDEGPAGFGRADSPGARVGTAWTADDLWLRTEFELNALPTNPYLRLHHDEDMEVYLNGELIKRLPYYTLEYVDVALDPGAADAFRIGVNTLAVHCRRSGFGQYCDAALYDSSEPTGR